MIRREMKSPILMENQSNTSLAQVASFVQETMTAAARMYQDKGRTEYKAELHRAAAAVAMEKTMSKFGFAPSARNIAVLLGMVDNHSAWRQRFEKAGIFPAKGAAPLGSKTDSLLAELAEEGVGE